MIDKTTDEKLKWILSRFRVIMKGFTESWIGKIAMDKNRWNGAKLGE